MLIDSDVMIWFYRGKERAQKTIFQNIPFKLSAVSYMEIIQGVRNKEELNKLKKDLKQWSTEIIQINETISKKAINLMEEYKLSHGLELGDAIIASTALEYDEPLITGNIKHYEYIPDVKILSFKIS
ncbi:ribonuclease VapC [Spirochaetia bacterium]|nr:ribonuclease VapC [Spirochaetia bacterium]